MIKGVPWIGKGEQFICKDDIHLYIAAELENMKESSYLFEAIKKEMQKRGRWKYKDRGAKPPTKGTFRRVSIELEKTPQVKGSSDDWEGRFW
jgi:hypothetical protein